MATITTLEASDSGSLSRGVINTNIENLNTDKIETSTLDTDVSLTADSDTKIATQKATKAYVDAAGLGNATDTTKGVVEIATQAEVDAGTAIGATGASVVVTPATLKPHFDFPDTFIRFISGNGGGFGSSDVLAKFNYSSYIAIVKITGKDNLFIDTRNAVAGIDQNYGIVVLGDYIYTLGVDGGTTPDTWYVNRWLISDITTFDTMTFSGSNPLAQIDGSAMRMTSDGTDIYISQLAGNSANTYDIGRYTISGTTLTYADSVSLGTEVAYEFAKLSTGEWVTHAPTNSYTDMNVYNSSGVLQRTIAYGFPSSSYRINNIGDNFYMCNENTCHKLDITL